MKIHNLGLEQISPSGEAGFLTINSKSSTMTEAEEMAEKKRQIKARKAEKRKQRMQAALAFQEEQYRMQIAAIAWLTPYGTNELMRNPQLLTDVLDSLHQKNITKAHVKGSKWHTDVPNMKHRRKGSAKQLRKKRAYY